jgi:hypothetical protein
VGSAHSTKKCKTAHSTRKCKTAQKVQDRSVRSQATMDEPNQTRCLQTAERQGWRHGNGIGLSPRGRRARHGVRIGPRRPPGEPATGHGPPTATTLPVPAAVRGRRIFFNGFSACFFSLRGRLLGWPHMAHSARFSSQRRHTWRSDRHLLQLIKELQQ